MNIALLGKLSWKIIVEPNRFWVQVLDHKYLCHGNLLEAPGNSNVFFIWHSIIKATSFLKNCFQRGLRNGHSSLGYSNWLGNGPLCTQADFVHIFDTNMTISDIWQNGQWCFDSLSTSLPVDVRALVLAKGPISMDDDGWIWLPQVDGNFSTKLAYLWMLCLMRNIPSNPRWKRVWKLKCPEKVKLLLWLCYHKARPMASLRYPHGLSSFPTCSKCNAPEETIEHCLRDCAASRQVWVYMGFAVEPGFFTLSYEVWIDSFVRKRRNGGVLGGGEIISFLLIINGLSKGCFIISSDSSVI